jgi:hypothetical protein
VYACCEANTAAGTLVEEPRDPERPEIIVRRCPECDRRHIEVELDPIVVGLTGASL